MKPQQLGEAIDIYEWPNPACEIVDGKGSIAIRNKRDAELIIESLTRLIAAIDDEEK